MKALEPVSIDGGSWWPEQGYLWADDGRTRLPTTTAEEEARASLARYLGGEYWCCGCERWFEKPAELRHFAGLYCMPCADAYKQANARLCGICHVPLWKCTC